MATLYQKYRPKNFAEIVNQNHIKITLQNELETNDISHAYLLSGPRGTGKTTIARVFAKALNCDNRKDKESEPCSKCSSCEQIANGSSLDIIEIDAASHTGVDNVRENIISSARVSVHANKYKVFIIDEVHMLSISAFNALLKIIEEPPKQVIFILATTEVHKLPTTIISRCQRFDVKRISVADIIKKLEYISQKEGITVDTGILETVARHSDGHMRDAESLFGQIISISGKNITAEKAELVIPQSQMQSVINFVENIGNRNAAGAISVVNKLVDEGIDLNNFNSDTIEILRKMMLLNISPQLAPKFAVDLGSELEDKMQPLAKQITTPRLVNMINTLIKAQQALKSAFILQLPLEIAAITLCADAQNPTSDAPQQPIATPTQAQVATPAPAADPAPVSTNKGPMDVKIIQSRWNEVLVAIKKNNHSLSFVLKVCEPREINGKLSLAFKYKFHKERLDQPNIKAIVNKVMSELFSMPIDYETIVDESLEIISEDTNNTPQPEQPQQPAPPIAQPEAPVAQPQSEETKKALEMFGGKVVG